MNKSNFPLDIAASNALLTNIFLKNKQYKRNKMIKYSYFSPAWTKTSDK